MKTIEVYKRDINLKDYKRRSALEKDCSRLINEDCIITDKGTPIIYYGKTHVDTSALRWAVNTIKYHKDERTLGLVSNSTVFGYMPRRVLLADYCHASSMASKFPKQHYIITSFLKELENVYEEYFPETYERHKQIIKERIKDEWKMDNSVFTSGIVNKNNQLKYHHDRGNFKGVLSNMVCFKKGVKGGRLSIPEYDIKLEISDNTLVIFDGQEILHGVTPIKKTHPKGYRYTIVYYSMEQMWKCDSLNEETARIRKVKKEREFKRLK